MHIRHIRTQAEFDACVALQEEIWGTHFSQRVPAAILKVSQRVGGLTAGAFDAADRLIGFVFGITGVENGELVHWSDMLAVCPLYRDHGIGRLLKEFQREALSRLGVVRMYWTFDPLVARNAHLNLNRLGVRIAEYIRDMYGDTASALHRGIGSDRFLAMWPVSDTGSVAAFDRAPLLPAHSTAPVLNAPDGSGTPAVPDIEQAPHECVLRVAIPLDIEVIQSTSLDAAARWRATTRDALEWGLRNGYAVRGFLRDDGAGYGYYILSTTPPSAGAS